MPVISLVFHASNIKASKHIASDLSNVANSLKRTAHTYISIECRHQDEDSSRTPMIGKTDRLASPLCMQCKSPWVDLKSRKQNSRAETGWLLVDRWRAKECTIENPRTHSTLNRSRWRLTTLTRIWRRKNCSRLHLFIIQGAWEEASTCRSNGEGVDGCFLHSDHQLSNHKAIRETVRGFKLPRGLLKNVISAKSLWEQLETVSPRTNKIRWTTPKVSC